MNGSSPEHLSPYLSKGHSTHIYGSPPFIYKIQPIRSRSDTLRPMDDRIKYFALARVNRKKKFRLHAFTYLFTFIFFLALRVFVYSNFWGEYFGTFLFGWAILLAGHYVYAYSKFFMPSKEWEELQYIRELHKLEKQGFDVQEEEGLRLKNLENLKKEYEDSEFV